MKDAIKSISLDDIGDMRSSRTPEEDRSADTKQGTVTQATSEAVLKKQLNYTPQYASSTSQQSGLSNKYSSFGFSSMTALGSQSSRFSGLSTRFSDAFGSLKSASEKRRLYLIGGGLILALGAGLVIIDNFNASQDDATEASAPPIATAVTQAPETVTEVSEKAATPAPEASVSPYDNLPNSIDLPPAEGAILSSEQDDRWRRGLEHSFSYQRFKAVQDARQSKTKGSEAILNDALAQPKFWTRMEGLLGLAELGQEIGAEDFRRAIGDARPSLVANYVRRFNSRSDEAGFHVLRGAMHAAPSEAKLVILNKLAQHRGPINDLYLIAGTQDPIAEVKALADSVLQKQAASEELMARFQRLASGEEKPPQKSAAQEPKAAPTETAVGDAGKLSPLKAADMKVEEIKSSDENVEDVFYTGDEAAKAAGAEKPK